MQTRTVEQVRSWDSRPFDGGLDALATLSEADHTGAVVADDTWLFMLNGRVIGLFEGRMEDFEASGTVYTTSHESLPLLFSMQERGGRTRAKYFTEDTPLAEADATLTDANFTGYVELSENVLSGDYYLVYYGGERRSVAYIGQSDRIETDQSAFDKATDEVGLYEVKDVSMTITEIPAPAPEPDSKTADTTTAAASAGTTSEDVQTAAEREAAEPDGSDDASVSSPSTEVEDSASTSASAHIDSATESAEPTPSETTAAPSEETASDGEAEAPATGQDSAEAEPRSRKESSEQDERAGTTSESTQEQPETGAKPADSTSAGERGTETQPSSQQSATPNASVTDRSASERSATAESRSPPQGPNATADESDSELERMFRAEAEWRQTRAIPALDPDETESPGDGSASVSTARQSSTPAKSQSGRAQSGSRDPSETAPSSKATATPPESNDRGTGGRSTADQGGARQSKSTGGTEKLETAIRERDERIDELETRLSELEERRSDLETTLESEREKRAELEAELESLRTERDELAAQVSELEATQSMVGEGTEGGADMRPAEALAGTNLFVRYGSKSEPTLEALSEGVDQAAVNENLTLEHHTQFDANEVTVGSQPFRSFLEETGAFRFTSWVLRELPYELLETGNRQSLGDLFEAIQEIDRIEFDGSVTVDAESGADSTFTMVMRDRMGNPLIVGEYTDRRNPVQGSELQALLDGASDVAETTDSLAAAFYVTASFFEPAALETAENAASTGGLFSRQDKASYVSPDAGSGFHLGLIEDRSQAFHVTVPKL